MPTGYTAPLEDGPMEFEAFVWRCARAMGALVMMRDDPMDAPIPERFEPHPHYAESLMRAKSDLAEALGMDDATATARMEAEYEAAVASADKFDAANDAANARFADMLAKVRAWQPPTPDHQGFRAFMIEQLRISMHDYRHPRPVKLSLAEWREAHIDKLEHDVAYYEAEWRKEVERTGQRNEWLADLRRSLAAPVAA
jgi:hypothetical protein